MLKTAMRDRMARSIIFLGTLLLLVNGVLENQDGFAVHANNIQATNSELKYETTKSITEIFNHWFPVAGEVSDTHSGYRILELIYPMNNADVGSPTKHGIVARMYDYIYPTSQNALKNADDSYPGSTTKQGIVARMYDYIYPTSKNALKNADDSYPGAPTKQGIVARIYDYIYPTSQNISSKTSWYSFLSNFGDDKHKFKQQQYDDLWASHGGRVIMNTFVGVMDSILIPYGKAVQHSDWITGQPMKTFSSKEDLRLYMEGETYPQTDLSIKVESETTWYEYFATLSKQLVFMQKNDKSQEKHQHSFDVSVIINNCFKIIHTIIFSPGKTTQGSEYPNIYFKRGKPKPIKTATWISDVCHTINSHANVRIMIFSTILMVFVIAFSIQIYVFRMISRSELKSREAINKYFNRTDEYIEIPRHHYNAVKSNYRLKINQLKDSLKEKDSRLIALKRMTKKIKKHSRETDEALKNAKLKIVVKSNK